MIEATCHCGAVAIAVARVPETLTHCDCSICRRYATLWAYYDGAEVRLTGPFDAWHGYARGPKTIEFMRCAICGCVTHWRPLTLARGPRIGVNARNFEPEQLGDVRIRRLDGAHTERYLDD